MQVNIDKKQVEDGKKQKNMKSKTKQGYRKKEVNINNKNNRSNRKYHSNIPNNSKITIASKTKMKDLMKDNQILDKNSNKYSNNNSNRKNKNNLVPDLSWMIANRINLNSKDILNRVLECAVKKSLITE